MTNIHNNASHPLTRKGVCPAATALENTDSSYPEYLNPRQAARYAGGLSTSFLAKLRMEKNRHRGPNFMKIGRAILYRKTDLDHWLASLVVGMD